VILAGRVLVNGQKVEKSGTGVEADADVRLLGEDLKYVSRGGLKLEAALHHWKIDLTCRRCMDVGASTGGFTDCMLQHGAAEVVAVDTGYGQIAARLRSDLRVQLLEKTNARYLTAEHLQQINMSSGISFIAMDVSFISVTLVLPAVIRTVFGTSATAWRSRNQKEKLYGAQPPGPPTRAGVALGGVEVPSAATEESSQAAMISSDSSTVRGEIVVLVKPQFEVGRELVGKGGIVKDERAWHIAVMKVREAVQALGASDIEVIDSPIRGMEGNREFLLYAKIGSDFSR